MMGNVDAFKRFARHILPPVVIPLLRWVNQRLLLGGPEWEYLPEGWATKNAKALGWNLESVAATQRSKWVEFLRLTQGAGPLGIAHEAVSQRDDDYFAHHLLMAFGYVLAFAAWRKDRITVLDWGGGIGHYFVFSRCLVPSVDIEYSCKDLPLLCHAGRQVLPEVRFIERDEDLVNRGYDLVLASGSLQCFENWKSAAHVLVSSSSSYVYVTRIPILLRGRSFVALQRPYAYGYETEYMCWFLNKVEFLEHMAELGLELVREFIFAKHPEVKGASEQAVIMGFMFRQQMGSC